MSSQADSTAAAAIRAHHVELHDGLRKCVMSVDSAVRDGQPYAAAREQLLAYLDGELLPHAAAEEVALYPAGESGASELLVRAMRDEHVNLVAHVNELRLAPDPLAAATTASVVLALFESHLSKENDLLVPTLVNNPNISLVELLGGMHELVG